MGSLKDEAFEKLDYLSQLTEIIVAPQNEVLGRLPDRIDITFDQINDSKHNDWSGYGFRLNAYTILFRLFPKEYPETLQQLQDCFILEASPDTKIDFANHTMTGTITLVKTVQQLEDKTILEIAVKQACSHLHAYNWTGKKLREKLITVINTFEDGRGTAWALQAQQNGKRIAHAGRDELAKVIQETILENKWRIRDVNVIAKVGQWIESYLTDTTDKDLGLVNLLKLKIMLEKDLPIYSINEVKNANPA